MMLDSPTVNVINIYNPHNLDYALTQLQEWLANYDLLSNMVWAGDFNKHHPLWARTGCLQHCLEAQPNFWYSLSPTMVCPSVAPVPC